MTNRIVKNLELIKAIHQCKKSQKKKLLKSAHPELVNAICDCVHNVLLGNVPLTKYRKDKLKSKKLVLRKLVDRKNKTPSRKKLLLRHGSGFLSSILGPVIKAIAGVIE